MVHGLVIEKTVIPQEGLEGDSAGRPADVLVVEEEISRVVEVLTGIKGLL